MADADPRRDRNLRWRLAIVSDGERASGHVRAVQLPGDAHCQGELTGAGGQIVDGPGRRAAGAHFINTGQGFEGPDEDTARNSLPFGDQVQALVHSVNEVDIGVAGRAEEHPGAGRNSFRGMRCKVVEAEIGLCLDDPSGGLSVDEHFAQQFPGDGDGVTAVETPWQNATLPASHLLHYTSLLRSSRYAPLYRLGDSI